VSGARVLQQAGPGNALVAGTPGAAYSYQAQVPISYFNNYIVSAWPILRRASGARAAGT
jgi:hypothetical protein